MDNGMPAIFEKLKHLFVAKLVLKHPGPEKLFIIQADGSDMEVGAVLLPKNSEGELQPRAFTLRKLSEAEKRWAIWEKEAYTVYSALLTWR